MGTGKQVGLETRARIKDLYFERGLGYKKIGKELGLPKSTVEGIVKHLKANGMQLEPKWTQKKQRKEQMINDALAKGNREARRIHDGGGIDDVDGGGGGGGAGGGGGSFDVGAAPVDHMDGIDQASSQTMDYAAVVTTAPASSYMDTLGSTPALASGMNDGMMMMEPGPSVQTSRRTSVNSNIFDQIGQEDVCMMSQAPLSQAIQRTMSDHGYQHRQPSLQPIVTAPPLSQPDYISQQFAFDSRQPTCYPQAVRYPSVTASVDTRYCNQPSHGPQLDSNNGYGGYSTPMFPDIRPTVTPYPGMQPQFFPDFGQVPSMNSYSDEYTRVSPPPLPATYPMTRAPSYQNAPQRPQYASSTPCHSNRPSISPPNLRNPFSPPTAPLGSQQEPIYHVTYTGVQETVAGTPSGPVMSHHMAPGQTFLSPSTNPSTPPEGPTSGLSTTKAQSSGASEGIPPGTTPEKYERNHQLPPATRQRIKELREEGFGIKRISKILGIPKTTVQGIVKHLKITGGDITPKAQLKNQQLSEGLHAERQAIVAMGKLMLEETGEDLRPSEVVRRSGLDIHVQTGAKILREEGLLPNKPKVPSTRSVISGKGESADLVVDSNGVSKKKRPGRPQKYTEETKSALLKAASESKSKGERLTIAQLKEKVGFEASDDVARRLLREEGLGAKPSAKKDSPPSTTSAPLNQEAPVTLGHKEGHGPRNAMAAPMSEVLGSMAPVATMEPPATKFTGLPQDITEGHFRGGSFVTQPLSSLYLTSSSSSTPSSQENQPACSSPPVSNGTSFAELWNMPLPSSGGPGSTGGLYPSTSDPMMMPSVTARRCSNEGFISTTGRPYYEERGYSDPLSRSPAF